MWVIGVLSAVFVAGVVWLFRWLGKWRDPSGDSEEGRAKAFLWSTKGSGGSPGA
ncbi:MAG: hypothetical protein M3273_04695 [Actinomycetota bacterium]|nr:hypothetical protein [Actinomycetota bacterium]